MTTDKDSSCYFVQLQIDSYLDGELVAEPREAFLGHIAGCSACAAELRYAQTLFDAVMDLPAVTIDEQALEPVYRLAGNTESTATAAAPGLWQNLGNWLGSVLGNPGRGWALAIPTAAVIALAIGFGFQAEQQSAQSDTAVAMESATGLQPQTVSSDYSVEEVQQALQDLNTAINYLNEVSRRTETMIGDRFIMTPLQESLNASFERARSARRERRTEGPI